LLIKKIIFLLLLSTFILFQACSETPTDAGAGLVEQDKIDLLELNTAVEGVPVTASSRKRTITLGTASNLLVGKRLNVEAGILIRFNFILPDTVKQQILNGTLTVASANITMTRNYTFGEAGDPLDFSVFRINSAWNTTDFNADSIGNLQYENINQNIGSAVGDSLTQINLQPQLAASWLTAAADTPVVENYGVYIQPTAGSNKVLGYYAVGNDTSLIPRLNVTFTGSMDSTIVYYTFADLGFVTGDLPQVSPGNIAVQGGLEAVSNLRFDLSRIPSSAIINKATISLNIDPDDSRFSSNLVNNITAFYVADTSNVDSLSGAVNLQPVNNVYSAEVTFFVQNWVKSGNNAGLMLAAGGRFTGVDLFSIYGPDAEIALRPRLSITYTVKQ
jgi:hypothetical protein